MREVRLSKRAAAATKVLANTARKQRWRARTRAAAGRRAAESAGGGHAQAQQQGAQHGWNLAHPDHDAESVYAGSEEWVPSEDEAWVAAKLPAEAGDATEYEDTEEEI
jgi:hypothetical protein